MFSLQTLYEFCLLKPRWYSVVCYERPSLLSSLIIGLFVTRTGMSFVGVCLLSSVVVVVAVFSGNTVFSRVCEESPDVQFLELLK